MTKSDDAALFELWLTAKDGDAFAELARRHAPVVYDLAARALGDRTAAEDVVQEALLDLALEPTRKPAEVGVVAWLARFAICRARNQRSSEKCRARRQQIVGLRRPEECMPDDHLERKEELDRALAAAEPDERTVLAMRYLHGWEYDRIAQALETSEGAARVRVHRALANVRGRLCVDGATESKVARGMAALAVIELPSAKLDAAIRSALDAAGVPAPALPASRIPAALRAGLQAFGAALLLAGAAASSMSVRERGASRTGSADSQPVLAAGAAPASASSRGASGAARSASASAAPRPRDWDGGALARLARGESEIGAAEPSRPRAAASAPAALETAAEAPPVAAPEAAAPQPPSAFRPTERGASAANCDPGSSDDERADALGGFARAAAPEPAEGRAVPAPAPIVSDAAGTQDGDPPARRRSDSRRRSFDAPEAPEQALVEEAAALVRDVVARAADPSAQRDAAESPRRARRSGERALKRQVREWRKGRDDSSGLPRVSARKAAKIGRVLTVLIDFALTEQSAPGALRWPDGVDVEDALQDLIRVLSAAPPAQAAQVPDIAAADEPAESDSSAVPEVR